MARKDVAFLQLHTYLIIFDIFPNYHGFKKKSLKPNEYDCWRYFSSKKVDALGLEPRTDRL